MRELKLAHPWEKEQEPLSHPSRVRELKRISPYMGEISVMSHPSRVRELKLLSERLLLLIDKVAPHPGAVNEKSNVEQSVVTL